MTSPTRDAGLLSTNTSSTTSHSFDVPTGGPGDRLYLAFGTDRDNPGFNTPSGWAIVHEGLSTDDAAGIVYWIDDGGETSVTVVTDTSCESVGFIWRVSGDADPGVALPDADNAEAGSGLPDPPNVSVTGGPKDVLVLIMGVLDNSENMSGAPASYSNFNYANTGGGSTRVACAFADRAMSAVSSENPGAFTGGGDDGNNGFTVIIQEAAAGGDVTLAADPSQLTLTGAVAVLGVTMVAAPGALALAGSEATLSATDNKVLQADPGALILTGATADLIAAGNVILVADPGALALAGAIATLTATAGTTLQGEPGVLLLTGATADLLVSDNVILVADPSQLTLTGAAATLTASDAPVLVARRGGVRFIREPEPETRAKKLIELKALVKPQATPDSSDGTITQKMALVVPKSKQRRVERLLAETGITLEELLIILN